VYIYIYTYICYDYYISLHYTTKNYGAGLGDFGIHLTGDHIHRDEVKDNVHLEIRSHGLEIREIGQKELLGNNFGMLIYLIYLDQC
jgi:hypothetical protein